MKCHYSQLYCGERRESQNRLQRLMPLEVRFFLFSTNKLKGLVYFNMGSICLYVLI